MEKSWDQCYKFLLELKTELISAGKQSVVTETNVEGITFGFFQEFISQSPVTLDDILSSKAWLSFLDNQKDVSVMTLIHIRILESKVSNVY